MVNSKNNSISLLQDGKHAAVLDGIRGFAVSYVLLYHFLPKTISNYHGKFFILWDSFWLMGWSGVDLFFVLSGFLITGILYKTKESKNYFKNFYIRRVLRIFPVYYLLILVFMVIGPLIANGSVDKNAVWYFAFLSNFDTELALPIHHYLVVSWSLAIEEQYYLFYPTLVYYLSFKNWVRLLLLLVIVSISIRFVGHYFELLSPRQMYHFTLAHFDGIALGGLIRLLLFKYEDYKKILQIYLKLTPLLVLTSVFIAIYVSIDILNNERVDHKLGHASFNSTMYLYGYFINSLSYGGIILWAIFGKDVIYKIFNNTILRTIGKYSFAMYLFQYIAKDIFHFMEIYTSNYISIPKNAVYDIFSALGIYFICFLLARISWILIEAPANNLKSKFAH